MIRLLSVLARPSSRRPGVVVAVLTVITVAFGLAAAQLTMETDLAEFGDDDSEIVQGLDRVRDEFDRGEAALQVIVDAGPDGDVLTPGGVAALADVERAISEELEEVVRRDEAGAPRVLSPTAALVDVLESDGASLAEADATQVGVAGARVMDSQPQLAGLFSADRDADKGRARAATVLAQLDPQLDTDARVDAAERLRERLGIEGGELAGDLDGFTVAVSSPELTNEALQNETQSEAPVLLLLALLAVIAVLSLLLRSVFDVLVGLAGLAATLAWTFGAIALLGPEMLDVLGPLSQVGVVVPVLVVGLGIDYAVHLSARYREQRSTGEAAGLAAATAMRTVGAALVLATVATAAGFAVTGLAPLSVIADFGIFTAIGVVAAFIVMGGLVPAARVLRDRGRGASAALTVRDLDVGRLLVAPLRLAVHHPVATLAVGALLAGGSLLAASDLDTSFDRDDFIPDDAAIGELHALQQQLFDGELTEATYVLVDGDLADPDMLAALRDAHQRLEDVEHVRTDANGRPQATSLVTLLDRLPDEIQQLPDLEERYDRLAEQAGDDLDRLLRPDRQAATVELRTNGGDGAAPQLAGQLHDAFAPVRDAGGQTLITSDALIIAEMADDLRDFQLRSIAITLLVVLALLATYYGIAHRRPLLGAIAMIPSVTSAALLLGTMGLLDISFDAMTATLTAIAVGIGVPYGVHVTNRFEEDLSRCQDPDDACETTLRTTGGALVGSALTTFAAFAVLSFSGLALIGRMGLLGAAGITFALAAAVILQPAALVLWARRHDRRASRQPVPAGMVSLPPAEHVGPAALPTANDQRRPAPAHQHKDASDSWELVIDDPRYASCRIGLHHRNGGVAVHSLRIQARPGTALTPHHTRQLPLDAMLELALSYTVTLEPADGDPTQAHDHAASPTTSHAKPGRRRLTDDHLAEVARHHEHATAVGVSPAVHIAQEYAVARSTATRWITEARRRNLLHTPAHASTQR
jgi:uncharacterized protein